MEKKRFLDADEVLAQPFSIERHKLCPYLDLEVIIDAEGNISYAIPSHQEFLIKAACKRKNWTREQLMDACPPEYYYNFMEWLIEQSGGCIPVWRAAVLEYPVTKPQLAALKKLKMAGLFRGVLPKLKDRN